ncbi:hypothetical protein D3C86_1985230 [compost metagenome]
MGKLFLYCRGKGSNVKTGRTDENQTADCSLETMEEYNGQSAEFNEDGVGKIKGVSVSQYP